MKIPAIIATSLLLWGLASASRPHINSKSASASGTFGGSWRKSGDHHGKIGTNSILSRIGASKAAATMVASAAVESKAGLRAGKVAAEELREALQLEIESANKNAEARILADDAAALVQSSAEAQSVAAAKTLAVEETSASIGAAAVEAEVAAAASKTSAGQALQASQTAASALRTSANSALMTLKLARIQSAASANAATHMEKAVIATNEANAAAQNAMAAESAAAEAAAIAAARQSEARDAAAEAKAAMAALITAQRNLVQAKARAAMSNEEVELDVKSRAADAKVNAVAQAASKSSTRRDELIEIGAGFGKASGEVITTGGAGSSAKAKSTASAIGIKKGHDVHHNFHHNFHSKDLGHTSVETNTGASSSAEAESSASAIGIKKGNNFHHNFHHNFHSKGLGHMSAEADTEAVSSNRIIAGGYRHGGISKSSAAATAAAQADGVTNIIL